MPGEYERGSSEATWLQRAGVKARMTDTGSVKDPGPKGSLQDDRLIHETFPSMGVNRPAHAGSGSLSPSKDLPAGQGDTEESLPGSYYSNLFSKGM